MSGRFLAAIQESTLTAMYGVFGDSTLDAYSCEVVGARELENNVEV